MSHRDASPSYSAWRRVALVSCALVGACRCEPALDTDVLSHLPKHEEQLRVLCARERVNAVTEALCVDVDRGGPSLTSLAQLQERLGLSFAENAPDFALTANSSSLAARSVSAINPRAIVVDPVRDDGNMLALGFARGDSLVELAVRAPNDDVRFYLVRYERDCDAEEDGCAPSETLTPSTEDGWVRFSLYDDEDLKNSVLDCLQCHQPAGPNGERIFRMQELQNPWTHWLASFNEGGRALLDDYVAAHGTGETYAGIPGNLIPRSTPFVVENFVKVAGHDPQPNPFPSPLVEAEVREHNRAQPDVNDPPGVSATWDALYQRALDGLDIPPPYHDVKVTDEGKLTAMTLAYNDFRDGLRSELPDIRDVFLDEALPDLSFRPKRGLDGRGILVHACAQCHNARLDQTLSRARFDATRVDELPRDVKDSAIDRLKRAPNDRYRMPPRMFRDLSDDEIEAVIAVLRE